MISAVTGAFLIAALLATVAGLWRALAPLPSPVLWFSYRSPTRLSAAAQRIVADRAAPLGDHNTPAGEETDRAFRASLVALVTLYGEE